MSESIDLRLGDCLEVMATIPSGSVDLILCDLPYGTTACKWDSVIPFEPLWEQYRRIAKPNAAIVLTASQPFSSQLVMSAPHLFRHGWIWEKDGGSNFATVKFGPMKEHEDVLVFGFDRINYYPIMQERIGSRKGRATTTVDGGRKNSVYGSQEGGKVLDVPVLRVPRSIQRFNRERGLHPTQKPVALMEYLIRTYTKEGETVLDNCMGSGTTGVAAARTGRKFIGIERDPGYFAIATNRIAEAAPNDLLSMATEQPEAA
ncbi:site-specific DNA-methyltransferase (adenine-specific) [Paraburkholderia phenoliruptrix]|uniref:DNA-methyltransferase n=1 Tax=Paraburkholderia phenoliruptrix TaxID=252970 RepID=UPI002858DB1D|nr:site-specific DNA-methyltransferase [Paraburkholderia phenoliruptrix]MDR6421297.1 site-specific DNA-methyltransferase (adenine-specific) [Paraburkholderia phenoliruptrix]